MKDFKEVLIFIIVAFIIPPILISSSMLFVQALGCGFIAAAFWHVHALDSEARLLRSS